MNISSQKELYKIVVIDGKVKKYIENTITNMSWGGNIDEASRTLDIECILMKDTKFSIGSSIRIYDNKTNKELMRFIITKKSISSSNNTIQYSAKDIRWWLLKNELDKKFINMTADEIIADICKTLGIPVGNLEKTQIKFKSFYFIEKNAWDMIITALTETRKRSGKRFIIKVNKGKIELCEQKAQTKTWLIEEKVNLINSSYEENIENSYTQVKVVGNDDKGKIYVAIASDEKRQKLYGIIQKCIKQSNEATQDEVNKIAIENLQELAPFEVSGQVETIGINNVETGDAIYIIDKKTSLKGGFYITADNHTYSNGYHNMTLTLSWTNELPEMDYTQPT